MKKIPKALIPLTPFSQREKGETLHSGSWLSWGEGIMSLFLVLVSCLPALAFPSGDCGDCHPDTKAQYEQSVHGQGRLKSGLAAAPNCRNCHLSHKLPAKKEIPQICGKCHTGIISVYKESIHGEALLKHNNLDAPACTDCHGVHAIAQSSEKLSRVNAANIPKTCAACHAVDTLMNKYGVRTGQVESYKASFHGKANLYGQLQAANCASCHGNHDVSSVNDPQSHVASINIAKTCGKCHPKALNNPQFAKSIMHLRPSAKVEPLVFYVQLIYIALITLTIGSMLILNIFDLYRRLKGRK